MPDVYRFVKHAFDGTASYRVYSSSGIETGAMMQWDATARYATPMTTTSGAIFLGVSQETNPLVGLGTTSQPLTGGMIRILSQGVHDMNTTSGETYVHRTPVFMGADTHTVTTISAGRLIGRVHLPDGSSVTGATGTKVAVRILGDMTNLSAVPVA